MKNIICDVFMQFWFHLCLIVKLFVELFLLLLRGTKTWVVMATRLICFAMILMPGWYSLVKFWLLDAHVIKNIEYTTDGAKHRNLLDLYLPLSYHSRENPELGHVIIFVSGGAWIIGYKLWSALVARALSKFGVLVVVPDYRNFPQGDIECMIRDIHCALQWTVDNCHKFGGLHKSFT